VKRAAIEPRDEQRTLLAEGVIDVGGGAPRRGAGTDRKSCAARVLSLDREQALGDGDRSRAGSPASSCAVRRSAITVRQYAWPPRESMDGWRVAWVLEELSVDRACAGCDTAATMTVVPASVTGEFVDAILARDLSRACGLLHPDIDFRAMTPKRVWEAEGPAGVEEVLRAWFEHPERQVEHVEPTEPVSVGDSLRVGWRVHGSGAEGPFVYEQQAYVREDAGQVVWLRVMCSGPRPAGSGSLT